MSPTRTARITANLETLIALGRLLERVERDPAAVNAEAYQVLVGQLTAALHEAEPGAALQAVLRAYPSSAELYENLHYAQAGLCRSPLDAALAAELRAADLIARTRRKTPAERG